MRREQVQVEKERGERREKRDGTVVKMSNERGRAKCRRAGSVKSKTRSGK